MKHSLFLDALRHIKRHIGRFVALVCIALLGTAFFVGIRATGPDMRQTAQVYYDELNFSDIRLLSMLGFSDQDIEAIKAGASLREVSPGYTADVLAALPGSAAVLRLMSWDENRNTVNKPLLLDGRLPEKDGEAAVDQKLINENQFRIGDVIPLSSGTDKPLSDTLSVEEVTVVGVVRSPLYTTMYTRGGSGIGSGTVDAFMLLPASSFTLEVYTEIHATVNNPDGLGRFDPDYQTLTDPAKTALEALGEIRAPQRYEDIVGDAREELDEARNKLADAEQELADAEQKLLSGERTLRDSQGKYDDAAAEFETQITDGQRQLDEADDALQKARSELGKKEKTLANSEARLVQSREELDEAGRQLGDVRQVLPPYTAREEMVRGQLAGLPEDSPMRPQVTAQLEELQAAIRMINAQITEREKLLAAGEAEWRAQTETLAAGRADWKKGKAAYDREHASYQEKLADFEKQRAEGEQDLREASDELEKAKKELADKQAEYDAEVGKNQPKLEEARTEIADGEKALEDIPEPEWFVLDLNANEAFADYKENCNRIVAVGDVFPLIFFLVAVLISLTAMTRTVEDDRTQIGLLKALGYVRRQIAMKYVLIAASATLLGVSLGVVLGFNLFPRAIAGAYNLLYLFPPPLISYNIPSILLASALSLSCTVGPALFVCLKSLRERPANLMLPKAPLPGRKIFLERIPAVWRRFSFLQKVTARNILRYVKRMLMTLVGIAGCTALVFSGFGLNEAVGSLIPDQFDRVMTLDCMAELTAAASETSRGEAVSLFEQNTASALALHRETVTIEAGGLSVDAALICPSAPEAMEPFLRLRDSKTLAPLSMSGDGVILSAKAARLSGVQAGDLLRVRTNDGRHVSLPVTALMENYINHYVCLTPEAYELFFGQTAEINTLFGNLAPDADREALAERLLAAEGMAGISFTDDIRDNFADSIGALSYVVALLVLSATALAFVVLFSLSGINVEERRREIATIKVLGFYDPEVSQYINRETMALSLCGAALGLLFGQGLLQFVVSTAEVDMIVFRREATVWGYLLSFALTVVFTLVVNRIMSFRLRRVDMVESLKSVE